jgi:hypothetical protein
MKSVHANATTGFISKDLGSNYTTEIWIRFLILWDVVQSATANAYGDWRCVRIQNSADVDMGWIKFILNNAGTRVIVEAKPEILAGTEAMVSAGTASISPAAGTTYECKIRLVPGTANNGIVELWWGTPGATTRLINNTTFDFSTSFLTRKVQGGVPYTSDLGTWADFAQYIDNYEVAESDIW